MKEVKKARPENFGGHECHLVPPVSLAGESDEADNECQQGYAVHDVPAACALTTAVQRAAVQRAAVQREGAESALR